MGIVMLGIQVIVSVTFLLWLYLWFSNQIKKQRLGYNVPDVQFLLKRWWAEWCIKQRARKVNVQDYYKNFRIIEYTKPRCQNSRVIKDENSCNSLTFYGTDQKGNSLFVKFARRKCRRAEISLQLATEDGRLYVLPDCPETAVRVNPGQEWSAAGLKVELLETQQRWRIVYNGMLRDANKGNVPTNENVEHIRLNFIFIANSRPSKWPGDWSSKLHSDALAREPWKSPEWINKIKQLDYTGVDQWGSMLGQVTFSDSSVKTLYLRGIYQQRSGKHESHQFYDSVTLIGVLYNGPMYYLGASTTQHSISRIQFGHIRDAMEVLHAVDRIDLKLSDFTEENCNVTTERTIHFLAGDIEHCTRIKLRERTHFYSGQPWNWMNRIFDLKVELNGKEGVGIMQLWSPYNKSTQSQKSLVKIPHLRRPNSFIQKDDYVLSLNDEGSLFENVVGGKCFSLAMLTSIQEADFVVPEGFCVTVFAFELQLKSYKELQQVIDHLEDISTGKTIGDLKKYCEEVERIIESTPVIEPVKTAILEAVEKLESSRRKNENISYAVRSSAVGEDSDDTSAAGQNSTYLGIKGLDNILKNIAKCWASLFSYKSVEYRRQHGLPVKASMGVCVQKMVNAEAAGVMFTRHPTTGDPSNVIITANYGLGETVVSAMVEPDTITIHRSWDNKLTVRNSILGKKGQKIVMNNEEIVTKTLEKHETTKVSISEEIALRLAAIGLQLENLFGIGRDVEWAVVGKEIFLLQARPITTLYTWTEFELIHELDSGVPSDVDILTFANVGEVLPNPISPLSSSTMVKIFNTSIAVKHRDFDSAYMHVTSMRCVMNYFCTFLRYVDDKITLMNKVADLAICGKSIITPEIHKVALERGNKLNAITRFNMLYGMFEDAWCNSSIEKKAAELNRKFHVNEHTNAHNLYYEINTKFEELYQISQCHLLTSRVCISYQLILISALTNGELEIGVDYYSDIANVLSSCSDVLGTQIPITLGQIVKCIKSCGKAEEFQKIEPQNCIDWLKTNCPAAAKQLKELIDKHGHRCIQEMDLVSEPWSINPENLLVTIQMLVKSSEESTQRKELSVEETVDSLKTVTSAKTKWLIRKILPLYRKSVSSRELTKSSMVHTTHKLKLAYRKLGKLMVSEGYIPDDNLIFFFTHCELGQLLENRNPALVQKAQRRRKLHPRLKELKYPEFIVGVPEPIKIDLNVEKYDACAKIQGMPACRGSVLGRACVIDNLTEATNIQQGDILITCSTDIAWSPYFPLLSGIVTELGGLISHGAVVAREYGIPCVIGATDATKVFQTGDTVLLAADVGTLQLINRPGSVEKNKIAEETQK